MVMTLIFEILDPHGSLYFIPEIDLIDLFFPQKKKVCLYHI